MGHLQFRQLVEEVVAGLPAEIARHLGNVVVDVDDEPSEEFLRAAGFSEEEIEAGESLFGYFAPMGAEFAAADMLDSPARIFVFRLPHVEEFSDPKRLRVEIRKTVIHEIAHHFGWSDRDLERFDAQDDPFGGR